MLQSDFPLDDGGLFYAMARDLQHNGFRLPAYTSYNGGSIPFAYPPLMLYTVALIDRLTPFRLIDEIRLLPLLGSMLTIPVFFVLARKLLRSQLSASVAVLVFAVLVGSFQWHIMGGGITRAYGFLFALLAISWAYDAYTLGSRWALALAVVFGALAQLSHPNMFAPLAIGLLFLLYGRNRRGVAYSAVLVAGVLWLTAPWWAPVLAHHGLQPFLDLRSSRYSNVFYHDGYPWRDLLSWSFTEQPIVNWSGIFAVIGLFACLSRGQYFLPLWVVLEFLVEPAQAHNFLPAPIALLVAVAVVEVFIPAWRRLHSAPSTDTTSAEQWPAQSGAGAGSSRRRLVTSGLFVALFSFLAVWSVLGQPELSHLKGLSSDERTNLEWIAANTPRDSAFAVVSGEAWWADGLSEWFPALTGRQSIFTAQGYEWLGKAFPDRIYWHDRLQYCAGHDTVCVEDIAVRGRQAYSYIYVSADCCGALRDAVRSSDAYTVVHEDRAGIVAAVNPARAALLSAASAQQPS